MTTVAELKKFLEESQIPDDAIIVLHGSDHSYDKADVYKETALVEKYRGHTHYSEDFGEEITPEAECGKRIPILLISSR